MASCSSSTPGQTENQAWISLGQTENQAWISLGDKPNQTKSCTFAKRTFRLKKPIYRSVQSSWFKKQPGLNYYHVDNKMFCFTCLKASTTGISSSGAYSRSHNAFVNRGYTNWKDASREKKGGFHLHERLHFQRHCTSILARSHCGIAEIMFTEHRKKAVIYAYLRKILHYVVFLAKQGLPFGGNWVPAEKEGEA